MAKQTNDEMTEDQTVEIETTMGDLICAIADAATDAHIDDEELAFLTQMVLVDLLRRYGH